MDESLKRQGFQGKVEAQDGVCCPSAMTLTWLGGPGWGWEGLAANLGALGV